MSDPRAFVSFDFDHDERLKNLFCGQARRSSPTPFSVADWSSKVALPQARWESEVGAKIGMCHLMIVLVGRSMATAHGVAKEIAMAKRQDVPIFGVYVDGAGLFSRLPAGLPRSRMTRWTWAGIAVLVQRCMREGKNRA